MDTKAEDHGGMSVRGLITKLLPAASINDDVRVYDEKEDRYYDDIFVDLVPSLTGDGEVVIKINWRA